MSERVDVLEVWDQEIRAARAHAFSLSNYLPDTAEQDEYERRCGRVRDLMATRAAVAELVEVMAEVVRTDDEAWAALRLLGIEPEPDNVALTNRARAALAPFGSAP